MRSQYALVALLGVFACGVLSFRDPENIVLEKDLDEPKEEDVGVKAPVLPGLPDREGGPQDLNDTEQDEFDGYVEKGQNADWSLGLVVVCVVLCAGWAIYPFALAFIYIPEGACEVYDCSVLSFWGNYAPAPVQEGENEEVAAAEAGEEQAGGEEAEEAAAEEAEAEAEEEEAAAEAAEAAEDEGAEGDAAAEESGEGEEKKETIEEMIFRRRQILFMEVLMSYVQTVVVVVIWGTIAAFVGPAIAQATVWQQSIIFALPIIRIMRVESKLADVGVLTFMKKDVMEFGQVLPPLPFMRTKGEVLDASVDGMAMVVIFVLEYFDPLYRARIQAAYGTDPFGYILGPLASICGLSGLLLLLNIVAYGKQIVAVLMRMHDHGWLAGDTAGMGGLAHQIKFRPGIEDIELKHMGRSMYEGIPQMIIQSYGIIGTGRGLTDNPVMGLAMAFGIVMITWRASVLLRLGGSPRAPFVLGSGIFMLGVVVYLCVKVFMAETCYSLMFSLLTWECVPAPTAI